jgi:hypothetical protein
MPSGAAAVSYPDLAKKVAIVTGGHRRGRCHSADVIRM